MCVCFHFRVKRVSLFSFQGVKGVFGVISGCKGCVWFHFRVKSVCLVSFQGVKSVFGIISV